MFFSILLFFVGFYILIKGANFLVDGATALARRFNISRFVIGLVIAGIGTSIPEFAVFFIANLTGEASVGLGTLIGANTFDILFILGVTALFFTLPLKAEWVHRDLFWNMLAVLVALSFALPFGNGEISRLEGLAMLILFSLWLYLVVKKTNHQELESGEPLRNLAFPLALGLSLAGLVGVIFGGKWVVDGAVVIAQNLGLSEALIGLVIVGVGTALPELAVTFTAARRGQIGIAVGNIIGSNVFDFLAVLGFAALVKPVVFPSHLFFDILVTLFSAALLYGLMFVGEPYKLKRWQGLFLALLYIAYLFFVFWRG